MTRDMRLVSLPKGNVLGQVTVPDSILVPVVTGIVGRRLRWTDDARPLRPEASRLRTGGSRTLGLFASSSAWVTPDVLLAWHYVAGRAEPAVGPTADRSLGGFGEVAQGFWLVRLTYCAAD